MAASSVGILQNYGHSNLKDSFKSHNDFNFKLIKTGKPCINTNKIPVLFCIHVCVIVSDFIGNVSLLYKNHGLALQTLISNHRKKNVDLYREK